MTRGKYAQKAAMRRAEIEATGNLADYQAKVAKLTAENKALKERLVEKDRAHSRETRRLKAEIHEGSGPTLRVVEAELQRAKDSAQASKQQRAAELAVFRSVVQKILGHVRRDHDMPGNVGLEHLLTWMPELAPYLPSPADVAVFEHDRAKAARASMDHVGQAT